MLDLYNTTTAEMSKLFTRKYTTSFAIGINLLDKSLQQAFYDIYGFVRLGDEIVDTFTDTNQASLLQQFSQDTYQAIEDKISINPVLHRFQLTVHKYQINRELIESFLKSMEMDLSFVNYEQQSYETYIYGSAEVVGLMCLKVMLANTNVEYETIVPKARLFGSALQKINFLRDLAHDYNDLSRTYFPNIDMENFQESDKKQLLQEIFLEFIEVKKMIFTLPYTSRYAIYVVYRYYFALYTKIKQTPVSILLRRRVRINNFYKAIIYIQVVLKKMFRI